MHAPALSARYYYYNHIFTVLLRNIWSGSLLFRVAVLSGALCCAVQYTSPVHGAALHQQDQFHQSPPPPSLTAVW